MYKNLLCNRIVRLTSSLHILRNASTVEVSTLPNGLRVASVNTGHPTCTVGVYVQCGSRFEEASKSGLSKFLERTLFQNKNTISSIDKIGGNLEASTGRERSGYYINTLAHHFEAPVAILSDCIQNPSFSDEVIETARAQMHADLEEADNDQQRVAMNHLHGIAYQGTPLSQPVEGTTAGINKINAEDLKQHLSNHFKAPSLVLCAVGGVNHSKLLKVAETYFSSLDNKYEKSIPDYNVCRYTGSMVLDRDDFIPLAHTAIGVEICGEGHKDIFPMMLMNAIVGDWHYSQGFASDSSNRITRISSEENDLLHSISTFLLPYKHNGLMGVNIVCDRMKLDNSMIVLHNDWKRIGRSLLESELNRAKNSLCMKILLEAASGNAGVAASVASQILGRGEALTPEELVAKIKSITLNEVKRVAYEYFEDRDPVVAGVGPVEAIPDYYRLRFRMNSFFF